MRRPANRCLPICASGWTPTARSPLCGTVSSAYGRTLRAAFFKAAHGLNPELEAAYAANRVGITRQLRYSPRSEKSLDIALSLNGIPVATAELKNPLTGQTVEDAVDQYGRDRDPHEPIFEFKRRTLVHFAVDTETVTMTTRLAGSATRFLPFDKGNDGGAGNPPGPDRPELSHGVSLGRRARARQPAGPAGSFHPSPDRGEAGRPGPQGEGRIDDFPALPPGSTPCARWSKRRETTGWGRIT